MVSSITITVNGETRHSQPQITLPQLLESLGMNPRLVAVEYNGEILHRQFWDSTMVREGDRLEVVTIVGGGCIDISDKNISDDCFRDLQIKKTPRLGGSGHSPPSPSGYFIFLEVPKE